MCIIGAFLDEFQHELYPMEFSVHNAERANVFVDSVSNGAWMVVLELSHLLGYSMLTAIV